MVCCPKCKHEFEPLVLDAAPKKRARAKKMTFATFLKQCKEKGEPFIPAGHHAWNYAQAAQIPRDYVLMAAELFRRSYLESDKLYADWRGTFRKALEGNWLKVWGIDDVGRYYLTGVGKQLEKTMQAKRR